MSGPDEAGHSYSVSSGLVVFCHPPGTIVYMPKELLLSGRMTQATDIYSFGLMSE